MASGSISAGLSTSTHVELRVSRSSKHKHTSFQWPHLLLANLRNRNFRNAKIPWTAPAFRCIFERFQIMSNVFYICDAWDWRGHLTRQPNLVAPFTFCWPKIGKLSVGHVCVQFRDVHSLSFTGIKGIKTCSSFIASSFANLKQVCREATCPISRSCKQPIQK